jgi:hypothetical protein
MTRGRSSIDEDVEMEITGRIYAQMVAMDWAHTPDSDHTRAYRTWTEDPQVGGRLRPFLETDDSIRVWLKNGPIKEYPRAIYGVGKYAICVTSPATPVQSLVAKTLGSRWVVDLETLRVKPLMVNIHREERESEEQRFAWGPAKDFKHLVWSAIKDQANGDPLPRVLCLVDTFARQSSTTDKAFHERVGKRLGITIKHVTDR